MENKKKIPKENDSERAKRVASRVNLLSRFFQPSEPSLWQMFKKSLRLSKEIEESADKKKK